jgi:hypothetical protein
MTVVSIGMKALIRFWPSPVLGMRSARPDTISTDPHLFVHIVKPRVSMRAEKIKGQPKVLRHKAFLRDTVADGYC